MRKELEKKEEIQRWLLRSISKENIQKEIAYFNGKHNKSYERTYGWAWLLKLAEELHRWDHSVARTVENDLQPLTELIVQRYLEFLPKLNYPIRVGEHPNTAFGLSFAYDYAVKVNHLELKTLIEKRAKEFYMNDENCPLGWEPSGFDFLSPCLEEAALMKRVLTKEEFNRKKAVLEKQIDDYEVSFVIEEKIVKLQEAFSQGIHLWFFWISSFFKANFRNLIALLQQ